MIMSYRFDHWRPTPLLDTHFPQCRCGRFQVVSANGHVSLGLNILVVDPSLKSGIEKVESVDRVQVVRAIYRDAYVQRSKIGGIARSLC